MRRLAVCLLGALTACAHQGARPPAPPDDWSGLEQQLAAIRETLSIPGMAAAVVEHGRIAWRGTFGWADVARRTPVSDTTGFAIASITKTMAAILIAQEVERGRLSLDAALAPATARPPWVAGVTVRHVLSHTSEGTAGREYLYNGGRFSRLTPILESAAGASLGDLLASRIFVPAGMRHTMPSLDAPAFQHLRPLLATPYALARDEPRSRPTQLPAPTVSAASGVIASIDDLARYAAAVLDGRLASAQSRALLFPPTRAPDGRVLPYGLGWFSQEYLGERVVWHYGQEEAYASLIVLLPERDLAFVALSNSAAMSDAARLLDGNIARSLPALAFLRRAMPSAPPRFAADTLIANALAQVYVGQPGRAREIVRDALRTLPADAFVPDLPLLYLLVRLDDRALDSVTTSVSAALLREHPTHPPALYFAAQFEKQRARPADAIAILERIDTTPGAYDHWSAILSYLELGEYFHPTDPARARVYLQRILDIGRDFGGAVRRARALLATSEF